MKPSCLAAALVYASSLAQAQTPQPVALPAPMALPAGQEPLAVLPVGKRPQ